ncbi:hypothetical protein L6R52_31055, partial [Myxococcota bacterium]|nr:hypothetical protein [Myxococcota bacterium]
RLPDALRDEAAACVAAYEALRFGAPRDAPAAGDVRARIERFERARRAQRKGARRVGARSG